MTQIKSTYLGDFMRSSIPALHRVGLGYISNVKEI